MEECQHYSLGNHFQIERPLPEAHASASINESEPTDRSEADESAADATAAATDEPDRGENYLYRSKILILFDTLACLLSTYLSNFSR